MKGEISMKKVELIDASAFLTETEKAVNLLYGHVEKIRKSASPQDKLEILRKILPEVKDYNQFQELSREREQLEFEGKRQNMKPIIPAEHEKKILNNRDLEVAAVNEELKSCYKLLDSFVGEIEGSLIPLLVNIHQLEKRKDLAHSLNKYAEGKYYRVPPADQVEVMYGFSAAGIKSSIANKNLSMIKNFVEAVKKGE